MNTKREALIERMNSEQKTVKELVTDAEILEAFENTNFGDNNHREILLEGVKKTAVGYHNGWTLTQIIRRLGLGVAADDIATNKLTQKGLDFILQAKSTSVMWSNYVDKAFESWADLNYELECLRERLKNWKPEIAITENNSEPVADSMSPSM